MSQIRNVTVLGANGTMGCNVAAIFASFGNTRVYMVSRKKEASEEAILRAGKSVKAGSIAKNMVACDYEDLEKCILESDLVFESVAENLEIKKEITRKVGQWLKSDAIMGSGSSGLALTEIAGELPEEKRSHYFGIHFFNPPYNLPFCELAKTEYSSDSLAKEIESYLKNTLRRAVVVVKDKPAFLGNRIGFQFINNALIKAVENQEKGGIDYIDSILGAFSGRAMAPILTADFVGIDVHKAIVDNLYKNTNDYAHETYVLPQFAQELIDEGKLGRKVKEGFYKTEVLEDGSKKHLVWDIQEKSYRAIKKYDIPFAKKMNEHIRCGEYKEALEVFLADTTTEGKLCREFIASFILYSLYVNREVTENPMGADIAMASGFNWCPPLAWIQYLSLSIKPEDFLRQNLTGSDLVAAEKKGFLEKDKSYMPSSYDWRPYIKAGR